MDYLSVIMSRFLSLNDYNNSILFICSINIAVVIKLESSEVKRIIPSDDAI